MYQTITTRFQEFKHYAKKRTKCTVCGKTFTRQRTFTATQNPWNRNEQGFIKNASEIYDDLKKKADAWILEPAQHGCGK